MVTRKLPRLPSATEPAAPPAAPTRRLSRLPAVSELPEYEPAVVREVARIQTPRDLYPEAAIPQPKPEAPDSEQPRGNRTDYAAIIQDYKDRAGNSRRKGIRAFCVYCTVGNVAEVKRCPAVHCPLHGFRMGRTPEAQARFDAKDMAGTGDDSPDTEEEGEDE